MAQDRSGLAQYFTNEAERGVQKPVSLSGNFENVSNDVFDANTHSQLGMMLKFGSLSSIGAALEQRGKIKAEKNSNNTADAFAQIEKMSRTDFNTAMNTTIAGYDNDINRLEEALKENKDRLAELNAQHEEQNEQVIVHGGIKDTSFSM